MLRCIEQVALIPIIEPKGDFTATQEISEVCQQDGLN
jgi:hypothetical protein